MHISQLVSCLFFKNIRECMFLSFFSLIVSLYDVILFVREVTCLFCLLWMINIHSFGGFRITYSVFSFLLFRVDICFFLSFLTKWLKSFGEEVGLMLDPMIFKLFEWPKSDVKKLRMLLACYSINIRLFKV